ncbi:hypothetical protein GCM10027039_35230 [Terrabacter koreensis]
MNSAGRGLMRRALVNASPKVSPIGTSRNVMSRTPAGASMSSAVVVDEREPFTGVRVEPGLSPRLAARPRRVAEALSAEVMVVMSVTHWK